MNLYQVSVADEDWQVFVVAADSAKARRIVVNESNKSSRCLRYRTLALDVPCASAGVIMDAAHPMYGTVVDLGLSLNDAAIQDIREMRAKGGPPMRTCTCKACGKSFETVWRKAKLPQLCASCMDERERASRNARRERGHEKYNYQRKRARMRGADPELTSSDIRAIAEAEFLETGRRPHYGEIAARPYLEQQAREMAERRRVFYASLVSR